MAIQDEENSHVPEKVRYVLGALDAEDVQVKEKVKEELVQKNVQEGHEIEEREEDRAEEREVKGELEVLQGVVLEVDDLEINPEGLEAEDLDEALEVHGQGVVQEVDDLEIDPERAQAPVKVAHLLQVIRLHSASSKNRAPGKNPVPTKRKVVYGKCHKKSLVPPVKLGKSLLIEKVESQKAKESLAKSACNPVKAKIQTWLLLAKVVSKSCTSLSPNLNNRFPSCTKKVPTNVK